MTFGTGVLQVGSTGGGVTELQGWLAARGFLTAAPTASGTFDAATDQAVKAFQLSAGIACDGQVGDGTRTAADAFTGTALSGGWHPGAVRDVQQTSIGGSFTTTTRRGVLHTTEGSSLPAYPNPPHFTVGRSGGLAAQIWQHYPVTVASRALANVPGPPETNRFGAVQIEIIGFAAASAGLATSEPDTFRDARRADALDRDERRGRELDVGRPSRARPPTGSPGPCGSTPRAGRRRRGGSGTSTCRRTATGTRA